MIFGAPETEDWRWFVPLTKLYGAMIASGIHFAEASYGDGECKCILGHKGETARGQRYNPTLQRDLIRTLLEPVGQFCTYWGGLTKASTLQLRTDFDNWIKKNKPPVVWLPRRSVAAANCHGELWPVFRAARERRTILVGPDHIEDLPKRVIGDFIHVRVPPATAWECVEETCAEVLEVVEDGDIVFFSSGMASPVSVHRLLPELRGRVTLWDVGAIFDPYCGVFSRKHYRLPEWQKNTMERNLR